jgi:hypothetical protein
MAHHLDRPEVVAWISMTRWRSWSHIPVIGCCGQLAVPVSIGEEDRP